ncbi:MAG: glycine cleavage system protein H [Pseudomonadota bacterium]
MSAQTRNASRSSVGYGSTYGRGGDHEGIGAVLGGHVWRVTPDETRTLAHPCLWTRAGVVKNKNCSNYYDCTACRYDQGMQRKVATGKQMRWQDAMRLRADKDRICRHSLTGRIDARACAYDYRCERCDFDQALEDLLAYRSVPATGETQQIRGFAMPLECHYHAGHAWARVESGGFIRIGMDDFSGKVFGPADAFELPLMGKELDPGKAGWGLRRKDHDADVLSPVGGVIVDVNPRIREQPGAVSRSPYEDGWLFTVRTPDVKGTLRQLMADADGAAWMTGEIVRLERLIEETAGPMATDGGFLANDIFGVLPQLGWSQLARTFLKTG